MTKKETVKNSKIKVRGDPYKSAEFEFFIVWKSLPPILRGQSSDLLQKMGFDEVSIELLQIKNQTEFAKRHGIKHLTTLSEWNKKIDADPKLRDRTREWAKKLTKNVVAALYRKAITEGDAARVRLWLEYAGEMEPEGSKAPTANTQFNQFVLNLGREQQQDIREYLIKKITNDAKQTGEIPSDE